MEITTEITFARHGAVGTLTLGGVIDIFEAERLHATALRAFKDKKASTLHVDLSRTERLDASALQILCALRQHFETSGRTIVFDAISGSLAASYDCLGITL